ncbi:E3 ubiquitin-protein ligase HUWE1, partial [Anas platyrhynchos]
MESSSPGPSAAEPAVPSTSAAVALSPRSVMDGSLPTSLKHIISNAEYYGPSLFLLATEVVTVFVFQEPSLLSSLQDNGLTDVMLHALLIKDVSFGGTPRDFNTLLGPPHHPFWGLPPGSSHQGGDTASNLGSAVDELMRHQPTLKTDATTAIIK